MPPELGEIIEDGPSRHRIRKGLIVVSRDLRREATRQERDLIAACAGQQLASAPSLGRYAIEADPSNPALLSVVTPLSAIHSPSHRDDFFRRLALAIRLLIGCAEANGCVVIAAGTNPVVPQSPDKPPTLCSDIHEIEVLDDLEVNRIYNLFRQYLPEVLAISTHSALCTGQLQKDLSARMRLNPASFTPPPLALFSSKQIDRLKRAVRRDHGVGDLSQLDIDLTQRGTIRLRFVDAQASLRFVRAQLLLFQAIAMHGRSLARQGSQVPMLGKHSIEENKALAIESGPGAIFRPDEKREVKYQDESWYQDRKAPERSSTALLQALGHRTVKDSGTIISALKSLKASCGELFPWLLGAELRKRGESCLVNYAEYQVRLFYVNRNDWKGQLIADQRRLLTDPSADLICEYNEAKFNDLASEITRNWTEKLAAARSNGRVDVMLDLRELKTLRVDKVSDLEDIWPSLSQALVGKPTTPDQWVTFDASQGTWKMLVLDAKGVAVLSDDTHLNVIDIERPPDIRHRCKEHSKQKQTVFGPFFCKVCREQQLPDRLCEFDAHFLENRFTTYCLEHLPLCGCSSRCTDTAAFVCDNCRWPFAEKWKRRHPYDATTLLCSRCFAHKFEFCEECAVENRKRLGKLRCAFPGALGNERHEKRLCALRHAKQWQVWGPHRRGIILCEHHHQRLGQATPLELLWVLITSRAPAPYLQYMTKDLYRLRNIVGYTRRQTLMWDEMSSVLRVLAQRAVHPSMPDRMKAAAKATIDQLQSRVGEAREIEGKLLPDICNFYRGQLRPDPSNLITGVQIKRVFENKKGKKTYEILVRVKRDSQGRSVIGRLIGGRHERVDELKQALGIEGEIRFRE